MAEAATERALTAAPSSLLAGARLGRKLTAEEAARLAVVLLPGVDRHASSRPDDLNAAGAPLPPPWRVDVDVLNGSGDINFTRQVASRVQAFGYQIKHVGRADSFNYAQTAVYFPPGCEGLASRLGHQIGVATKPLPGGTGACALYVIVGPA